MTHLHRRWMAAVARVQQWWACHHLSEEVGVDEMDWRVLQCGYQIKQYTCWMHYHVVTLFACLYQNWCNLQDYEYCCQWKHQWKQQTWTYCCHDDYHQKRRPCAFVLCCCGWSFISSTCHCVYRDLMRCCGVVMVKIALRNWKNYHLASLQQSIVQHEKAHFSVKFVLHLHLHLHHHPLHHLSYLHSHLFHCISRFHKH